MKQDMSLNFQLFRLHVIDEQKQVKLFSSGYRPDGKLDRYELLKELFKNQITQHTQFRKWGSGNYNYDFLETDKSVFLKFGKIRERETSKYDGGNFFEEKDIEAPFTHILFELNLQVLAIAQNTKVAPYTKSIANAFAKYLNSMTIIKDNEVRIDIETVNDPADFISFIENAYQISKFWVKVKHPNHWDSNADFLLPIEKAVAAVEGENIKAEFSGKDLKKEPLEEFTRSCAAKGNDAGAKIKTEEDSKPISKQIGNNPVIIQGNENKADFMKTMIEKLRKAYDKIRHGKK